MKKITMILCLLMAFSFSASAQENDHQFSIRTNPLQLLLGLGINGEISYGTGNWAFGLGGARLDLELEGNGIEATQLHARADYWFRGAFNQGWYLSLLLGTANIEVTVDDLRGEADATFIGFGGGYRWAWENFFIDLGALATTIGAADIEVTSSDGTSTRTESASGAGGLGLDFNIGWAF